MKIPRKDNPRTNFPQSHVIALPSLLLLQHHKQLRSEISAISLFHFAVQCLLSVISLTGFIVSDLSGAAMQSDGAAVARTGPGVGKAAIGGPFNWLISMEKR
jgi:hypothetical protein